MTTLNGNMSLINTGVCLLSGEFMVAHNPEATHDKKSHHQSYKIENGNLQKAQTRYKTLNQNL